MVNEVSRILVDKKLMEVNGHEIMRLYFYDVMDGIVLMYDAPVFKSKGIPKLSEEVLLPEEPQVVVAPEIVVKLDNKQQTLVQDQDEDKVEEEE